MKNCRFHYNKKIIKTQEKAVIVPNLQSPLFEACFNKQPTASHCRLTQVPPRVTDWPLLKLRFSVIFS